ncbi:hypothetical protein R3P38DRAFT_3291933, partial [Favolaschia claudopus]
TKTPDKNINKYSAQADRRTRHHSHAPLPLYLLYSELLRPKSLYYALAIRTNAKRHTIAARRFSVLIIPHINRHTYPSGSKLGLSWPSQINSKFNRLCTDPRSGASQLRNSTTTVTSACCLSCCFPLLVFPSCQRRPPTRLPIALLVPLPPLFSLYPPTPSSSFHAPKPSQPTHPSRRLPQWSPFNTLRTTRPALTTSSIQSPCLSCSLLGSPPSRRLCAPRPCAVPG